jgi:hypothetical protein
VLGSRYCRCETKFIAETESGNEPYLSGGHSSDTVYRRFGISRAFRGDSDVSSIDSKQCYY